MVLLAVFILLLSTLPASYAAASSPSITTQLQLNNIENVRHQNYDASLVQQPTRQLQSFSITDMLTLSNSTCSTNCPLCDCIYQNFTSEDEELACTLNKSIEA